MNLESYLKEKKVLVDEALKKYLQPENFLFESMAYSAIDGGKRLRPILTLAAYETLGGKDIAEIMSIACGMEMIHAYSLIHDDLPAMDNDDYRRGKPTNHKVFGEGLAILAGDGLYALAFELFSEGEHHKKEHLEIVKEMARITGPRGIVYGQALDIKEDKDFNPRMLRRIHENKTAKFFAAAMKCGSIMAAADKPMQESMYQAGLYVGMLFQITDDILDVTGSEQLLGKGTKKDELQNKLTYPKIYGLERARFRARRYAELAQNMLLKTGKDNFEFFIDLTEYILKRNF